MTKPQQTLETAESQTPGTVLSAEDELRLRVKDLEKTCSELQADLKEMHKGHSILLASLLHALLQKKVDHATLVRLVPLVQTRGLSALGFSFEENEPQENKTKEDNPPPTPQVDALERYKMEGITVWDGKTSTGRQ